MQPSDVIGMDGEESCVIAVDRWSKRRLEERTKGGKADMTGMLVGEAKRRVWK